MTDNFFKDLIMLFMSEGDSEYYDWYDDEANFIFNVLVNNIDAFMNILNTTITLKENNNIDRFTPIEFEIISTDTDAIEEMIDGSLTFDGSVRFSDRKDFRLGIRTRDFNIFDVVAMNMDDNTEVVLVDNGKIVKAMERTSTKNGRTISHGYKYTYGETIE